MLTEERAYDILELQHNASEEEIAARYQKLKEQYRKIKEGTNELRIQLDCQRKQIELDDAIIYFRSKQRI